MALGQHWFGFEFWIIFYSDLGKGKLLNLGEKGTRNTLRGKQEASFLASSYKSKMVFHKG